MSQALSWNLHLKVRDGQSGPLKLLMEEMVASTREEPGTLAYEWFLSEDGGTCHLYERYADDEAALAHMGMFGSRYEKRFQECLELEAMHVYGHPGDESRANLAAFGGVFMEPFGGFSR